VPVVLLVRHGQASFGAADYDVLSDVGHEQAAVVGREIARRGLRDPLLVTGTLRRQRETAEGLGLGAVDAVDGRLDEYDHLGLVRRYPSGAEDDGTSRGLQVLLDAALATWVDDAAGGWPAFRDGAVGALEDVAAQGRDAVVVTSGGIVAAICGVLLGVGAQGVVALNRVMLNGAVTKVVVGRSGASLVSVNDHAHLEPDRRLLTYR
jgi:broad specificity phosphatase PhoE